MGVACRMGVDSRVGVVSRGMPLLVGKKVRDEEIWKEVVGTILVVGMIVVVGTRPGVCVCVCVCEHVCVCVCM